MPNIAYMSGAAQKMCTLGDLTFERLKIITKILRETIYSISCKRDNIVLKVSFVSC